MNTPIQFGQPRATTIGNVIVGNFGQPRAATIGNVIVGNYHAALSDAIRKAIEARAEAEGVRIREGLKAAMAIEDAALAAENAVYGFLAELTQDLMRRLAAELAKKSLDKMPTEGKS